MKPVYGTFGIFRWVLATLVMVTHFAPRRYGYVGDYAVYAFFILSGYIVTYIFTTRYYRLENGIFRFYLNRALRVYPLYWVVLLLSWIAISRFPEVSARFHLYMQLPESSLEWAVNLFAVGIASDTGNLCRHTFVPTAWSLGIELQEWIILPFIVCVWENVRVYFMFALAYTLLVTFYGGNAPVMAGLRYYSPLASMLPFSIGALLYFRKTYGWPDPQPKAGIAIAAVWAAVVMSPPSLLAPFLAASNYPALILSGLMIYSLSSVEKKKLSAALARLDGFMGDLSYPIFLIQMLIGVILKLLFPQLQYNTWGFYFAAFFAANIIAIALHYAIEVPVYGIRAWVRNGRNNGASR